MELSLWIAAAVNSLKLALGSCAVACLVGTFTSLAAWRSGLAAGRLLPMLCLAVPPYLLVLCVGEVTGYFSPWVAAISVLGLCNAAFVHGPMVSFLGRLGDDLYEAALVATGSRVRALLHVLRPALAGALPIGLSIVACEALSELGVSRYYGLHTSLVMTFTFWNATIAVERIIRGLVLMVLTGLLFAFLGRRSRTFPLPARRPTPRPLFAALAPLPSLALVGFCAVTLLRWASGSRGVDVRAIFSSLGNSGVLVGSVALGCTLLAVLMSAKGPSNWLLRIGLVLYSIPALVFAVLLLPVTAYAPSLLVLIAALLIRFSCLMIVSMDSVLAAHGTLREALRALAPGRTRLPHLVRLYAPGLVTGLCLVSLDVLRELPLSMVLQPLDFTTLPMRISYLANTEMISAVAPEALVLFGVSLALTALLMKAQHALSA